MLAIEHLLLDGCCPLEDMAHLRGTSLLFFIIRDPFQLLHETLQLVVHCTFLFVVNLNNLFAISMQKGDHSRNGIFPPDYLASVIAWHGN